MSAEITKEEALEEKIKAVIKAAWLAGFAASGEGWNGEYPPHALKRVEDDAEQCAIEAARAAIAAMKG